MKLNARQCSIIDVSKSDYKAFVEQNHRQGYAAAKVIYGLVCNHEIVQILALGKPRYNSNYQWELIRDCTKKDCIVRGGLSKLWKHFLSQKACHSCICYSYPTNNILTEKYTSYCSFVNIKRAKETSKTRYRGIWNGKEKIIDKAILERHGVDRLLHTEQGQDRTNEQILLDLNFTKEEYKGLSPQVDIYYPFGLVYRIDDLTDGTFYIGMCERKKEWESGYLGSGSVWKRHIEKHPNKSLHANRRNKDAHLYKRTVLKDTFKTPKDTREYEVEQIRKYLYLDEHDRICKYDNACLNCFIRSQTPGYVSPTCSECGAKGGYHLQTCSHYHDDCRCPECGGSYKRHKNNCSQASICSECGGRGGKHLKGCSKKVKCSECGGLDNRHKKGCSQYVGHEHKHCEECGGVAGSHKKTCSHYKEKRYCEICGGITGAHKKTCIHYTPRDPSECCPYCHTTPGGQHKIGCPNDKKHEYSLNEICPECDFVGGYHHPNCTFHTGKCPVCNKKNHKHKRGCPEATFTVKENKCTECGFYDGYHNEGCSHIPKGLKNGATKKIICAECGGKKGMHKATCSKYVRRAPCDECGAIHGHKKTCSHYAQRKECPYCHAKDGNHYGWCINVKKCPECGGTHGNHKDDCSHKVICSECGGKSGRHYKTCSLYIPHKKTKPCAECGGRSGKHYKTCSHYKPAICAECGGKAGHHIDTCSHFNG